MPIAASADRIAEQWDREIVPHLVEYIRIPAKSPHFDHGWEAHGHIERVIRPALARGAWVICDRFADSTRAYQGAAGGVAPEFISALETYVLESTRPDLTLVFDLPAEVGLERAHVRAGAEMRFESKGMAFHERLREGFRAIAAAEPERCALIDATASMDAVEAAVWAAVGERLAVHG